jgi:hypothetical protein
MSKNTFYTNFVAILKAAAKKRRIRNQIIIYNSVFGLKDPDPYQNVTDPEHCKLENVRMVSLNEKVY